jgi:exonuclease SbcC
MIRLLSLEARALGAFDDVRFDVSTVGGPLVAVTGDNGDGKSTLLELFAGLLYRTTPTHGSLIDLARRRGQSNARSDARLAGVVEIHGVEYTIVHNVNGVTGTSGASTVTTAAGPVTGDGKASSFKEWAAAVLPEREVFFASLFSAQGEAPFLGLQKGDRKSVLLKTIGLERYEAMAGHFRTCATEEKIKAETHEKILTEARAAGAADLAGIEEALVEAQGAERRADEAVAIATAALEAELAREGTAIATQARLDSLVAERSEVAKTLLALHADEDALCEKIRNNQRVLADEAKIRAAAATVDGLKSQLAEVEKRIAQGTSAREARAAEAKRFAKLAAEIEPSANAIKRVRAAIAQAKDAMVALPQLRATLPQLQADLQAAEKAVVDAKASAAAARIAGLRGGLVKIVDEMAPPATPDGGYARAIAVKTLEADDHAKASVADPLALLDRVASRKRAAENAEREVRDLEAFAGGLAAAEADYSALRDAARKASELHAEAKAADEAVLSAVHDLGVAQADAARLHAELQAAMETARYVSAIDQAAARLEAYRPQLASLRAGIVGAQAKFDSLEAECEATRLSIPTHDVPSARRELAQAQQACTEARRTCASTSARLAVAKAAEERAIAAEADAKAARGEQARWNHLAIAFGRDGIQALEIDAAGPRLTELTNDLLRTCFGNRFSVAVQTQRTSSDGKKTIEECEVIVTDHETGGSAPGETFSGGEKVLIGEALSLALMMIATRRLGGSRPTLVRDESGAAMSATNAPHYVAMLRRAADLCDADRVLFVTHNPEILPLADARVSVRSLTKGAAKAA